MLQKFTFLFFSGIISIDISSAATGKLMADNNTSYWANSDSFTSVYRPKTDMLIGDASEESSVNKTGWISLTDPGQSKQDNIPDWQGGTPGNPFRLNGMAALGSGHRTVLNGATIDSKGVYAFYLQGDVLDLTDSTIQGQEITVMADSDHRGNVIHISKSRLVAEESGIYLNGTGTDLDLSQTDITAGESALYIRRGGNTTHIHGGKLISTGKQSIGDDQHPDVKSGAMIIHLSDKDRWGGQTFSVDSNAHIEGLATDSAGLYIMNGASTPVTGQITDSQISGGKYGIYATDPENTPGTVTLVVDHSQIYGRTDAAMRVEGGVHLNVMLKNNSQLASKTGTLASVGKNSHLSLSVADASLAGNLLNNEGGTSDITLYKSGTLTGGMRNITGLTMEEGSLWYLTESSSIGNLSNGGTISLSQNNAAGNTLKINGNYAGNNGNLLFNSTLSGDASVTDRLVVTGNTSGTTNVFIRNAGGTGAKTVDGIEVIDVTGGSEGNFKQAQRITAGAYDYWLVRGQGINSKNWYLESHINDLPVNIKPSPVHITRPEAGAYIANQAASSMFLSTRNDRAGGNRYINNVNGNLTSFWLRQLGTHHQFHDSTEQLKTTGNTYVAQLGGDLTQWSSSDHDRFHLGLMGGYGNNHNNTTSSFSGYSSKGGTTGYTVGTYGTWYQYDAGITGVYVDNQLMYSWFNNHINGDGIRSENYKSRGLTASIETGYTLDVGKSGTPDAITRYFLEPQIQATWMGVKADRLTEANGSRIIPRGHNNLQTRVGVRTFMLSHHYITRGKDRSFQPFVEMNWLHNTKRNGVTMNGVMLGQDGAMDTGEVKLGVEGQLTEHTQLWCHLDQQIGGTSYRNTGASLALQYVF
jgi:autotransporter family porin